MNFKKIYNYLQLNLFIVFIFILTMFVSFGCSGKHSKLVAKEAEIRTFDQKQGVVFAAYMAGNVEQARQALNQAIQQLEESSVLDLHSQSAGLYIAYIHLYALEKRTGNETHAEVALIKARYWWIKNLESRELSNNETIESKKVSDDKAIAYFISATPEQIMKWVNTLDAGDNEGKPKYLQYITNSPIDAISTNGMTNVIH